MLVDQVAGFECHASSATPPPQVTWFKDSFEITLGSDDDRVFISNQTGTLLIREVTDSDEGTYHCQLSNIAGVLVSKRAVLTVISSLPSQGQGMYMVELMVTLLVWTHEVEPWFHSWYRGRVGP